MIIRNRLVLARVWMGLITVFVVFLIVGLLVLEFYLNLDGAYPDYTIEMYLFGSVHTRQYLTWGELAFNFDSVVAGIPYDIIISFFQAGLFLAYSKSKGGSEKTANIKHGMKKLLKDKGFLLILASITIMIVAFIGSSGLYGFQEPNVQDRIIFFQGIEDQDFMQHLLPLIITFVGLSPIPYICCVNNVGSPVTTRRVGFTMISVAIVMFSVFFLFLPFDFGIILHPNLLELLIKNWLIVLITTIFAINIHVKRASSLTDEIYMDVRGGCFKPYWIVLIFVPFFLIFLGAAWVMIIKETSLSADAAALFKHTFNIASSVFLTLGLFHFVERAGELRIRKGVKL
ncbi:MAG: hypothetical protein ACFFCS_20600 [Candidatus Hodarchaeota archaeon]